VHLYSTNPKPKKSSNVLSQSCSVSYKSYPKALEFEAISALSLTYCPIHAQLHQIATISPMY